MLNMVVLTFKSVHETSLCAYSNESYLAVISFGILLKKVFLTFKSVDET